MGAEAMKLVLGLTLSWSLVVVLVLQFLAGA